MNSFWGMPPNYSTMGADMDHGMEMIHWLMAILFVGWTFFFIFTLVRFRQSKSTKASYQGAKSKLAYYLAAAVAIFELITLFVYDVPFWSKRVDAFPAETDATVIRVVAEQFAWNVHYPGADGVFGHTTLDLLDKGTNPLGLDRSDPYGRDDIVTLNQLHAPLGKPIIIYLSSKDVIHSFFLPEMRVKQDAIPGMEIPIWFEPTGTNKSQIACAQLCGIGHYRMRGYLTIETPEEYAAWTAERLAELAEENDEESETTEQPEAGNES